MIKTCFFRWGFWIRIRGYGLYVKPSKGFVPFFSERYGLKKAWYFAGLRWEILKP